MRSIAKPIFVLEISPINRQLWHQNQRLTQPELIAAVEPEPQPRPEPVAEVKPEPRPKPDLVTKPEPEPILSNAPETTQEDQKEIPQVSATEITRIEPMATQLNHAVSEPVAQDAIDLVGLAENEYRNIIVSKIEQNKFYPKRVKRMRKEGDVTVEFILNRNGSIRDMQVIKVIGPSALKKAALKAIKVSALFPPFPEQSPRQQWSFKTNLQYRLQ